MPGTEGGQQVNAASPRVRGEARPRGSDPTALEKAPWPKGSAQKQVVTEFALSVLVVFGPLHVHEGGLSISRVQFDKPEFRELGCARFVINCGM